jgi:DNA-binding transcriptional regulator YiaG
MRMSNARKGAVVSDETKLKISAAMKGNLRSVGRVVTCESNAKNRASQPHRKLNESDAKYIRENPDNMTQQALANQFGVSRSLVYLVIYGKSHGSVS